MEISPSASAYSKPASQRNHKAILPLVPIEDGDWKTEQSVTHTLRSTPADPDSPKYKIACRILQGDEDCRTILQWSVMCNRVLNGLNVIDHNNAIAVLETLMVGTPLSLFQNGVETEKDKNLARRIAAEGDATRKAQIRTDGVNHRTNLTPEQVLAGVRYAVIRLLP